MARHLRPRIGVWAVCALLQAAEDPREIVRRSLILDQRNSELAQSYTFLERAETRELDSAYRVKKRETKTYDVTLLEGSPYRRLVERDDKRLSGAEEEREQEKLRKSIAERQKESPAEKAKRLEEWEKRRQRRRQALQELPDAFDFRLLGEEVIEGRPVYVIAASPHAGYHAKATAAARLFPKVTGKVWIDKQDYQWVRAEAEITDTISLGLFLARVDKGSRFALEQTKVNDEVWLPKRIDVKASARLVLLKKYRAESEVTYKNYRKFQTDSRIIPNQTAP